MAENDETLATPCAKPSTKDLSQEHGQAVTMKSSEKRAVSKLHCIISYNIYYTVNVKF